MLVVTTRSPSTISCVVPCFNEAANLQVLVPALMAVLKTLADRYEIILVDDGSRDHTVQALTPLLQAHPQLVMIELSRNFGKEAALSAGLAAAKGQVIITMDADLQHPPALLPKMLERWSEGVQMVYAVRATRRDESWAKRMGTRFFYKLMRTSGGPSLPENAGDFRLMDRVVVDALLMLPERNRFMKGLFAWVGFRAEPLAYEPPERLHGRSTFKPFKLFDFALDGLTAFTTWPLRMVSTLGMLISLMSFVYGAFIVIDYFVHGNEVQGWVTLITVILFFSGINLLSVGVLGEYVGRIFNEVKQRPVYLVQARRGQGLAKPTDSDGPQV
ncbi:glycosyltransferase family 2 protein [Pusillimonas sp. CC-YST705]|uniref:Glycosyltransferase family 2 protein n=1 Tax=Mesopusillimonas faecipullorum TaxID=2755040 RepID=A0ABS8CBW1_9BURK|nr:glycosyltransferase family 2 protein [Mesopusillimonas faecipullorum]